MDSRRRPDQTTRCWSEAISHEIFLLSDLVSAARARADDAAATSGVWDIKPDLGLVVAALIGFWRANWKVFSSGLAIGWVLNLFSAGDLWLSLVTTGGAGLFAGLVGRQVLQVTPTILAVGAAVVVVGWRAGCRVEYEVCDDV